MLCTAYHGSAAPTGPWRGHHRSAERAKYLVKKKYISSYRKSQCGAKAVWHRAALCPIGLLPRARRRGASGGGRRGGGGGSTERHPRVTPPNMARRGEIKNVSKKDTETQTFYQGLHLHPQKGVRWALHGRAAFAMLPPTG
jgi:hypothetical protein